MISAPMVSEKLIIRGSLMSTDFPDWIIHRACRLGLRGGIVRADGHVIETLVAGPLELIDAMEVGCSLGPISVQVEHIDRFSFDFDLGDRVFGDIREHAGEICAIPARV